MVKFVLHFGFLVAGVALLARRGIRFYWYALAAFCGGIALNAGVRRRPARPRRGAGTNLDELLIEPITSRQTGINVFGAVGGTQEVFRPNALTGDPNHLGIELVVPLLVLTPLYLRLERGHRLRTPLAVLLAFLPRRRARDALAERRCSGSRAARSCWRSRTAATCGGPRSCPARRGGAARRGRGRRPARLLPDRAARADEHEPRPPPRRTSRCTRSSRTCSRRIRSSGSG